MTGEYGKVDNLLQEEWKMRGDEHEVWRQSSGVGWDGEVRAAAPRVRGRRASQGVVRQ